MTPKLYVMLSSPPCRAVMMVAKAIGLELELEEVDREALRTPEMLEVGFGHGFLEEFLNGHPWLAGDEMTIADLCILPTLATAEMFVPVEADRFPQLSDWLKTGKELPYFEECNAEGIEKLKALVPTPESFKFAFHL